MTHCAVEQCSLPMPQSVVESTSVPIAQFGNEQRSPPMPQSADGQLSVPVTVRLGRNLVNDFSGSTDSHGDAMPGKLTFADQFATGFWGQI